MVFFFKQKTADEMRISDWSSDVCSSDLAAAGAFSLVVEGVVEPIAVELTRGVDCPTIGIGASAQCDGQVLVAEDMLGLFERTPRFVKRFDDLAGRISASVETYAGEVRSRAFPGAEQTYAPKD